MPLAKKSSKDLEKHYKNMLKLTEKENELMIKQNEKEREKEVGVCCFDTALKGSSKIKMKTRRN